MLIILNQYLIFIYICFLYTSRKLNQLLTSRIIKFLHEKSIKELDEYMKFYQDYGVFIKEGVVTNDDPKERVSLLLFKSIFK